MRVCIIHLKASVVSEHRPVVIITDVDLSTKLVALLDAKPDMEEQCCS